MKTKRSKNITKTQLILQAVLATLLIVAAVLDTFGIDYEIPHLGIIMIGIVFIVRVISDTIESRPKYIIYQKDERSVQIRGNATNVAYNVSSYTFSILLIYACFSGNNVAIVLVALAMIAHAVSYLIAHAYYNKKM